MLQSLGERWEWWAQMPMREREQLLSAARLPLDLAQGEDLPAQVQKISELRFDLRTLPPMEARRILGAGALGEWLRPLCAQIRGLQIRSPQQSLLGLDLSAFPALEILDCKGCGLRDLYIQNCPSLHTLNCGFNRLAVLDASGLKNLQTLDCQYNKELTRIELAGCKSLQKIEFVGCRLLLNIHGISSTSLGDEAAIVQNLRSMLQRFDISADKPHIIFGRLTDTTRRLLARSMLLLGTDSMQMSGSFASEDSPLGKTVAPIELEDLHKLEQVQWANWNFSFRNPSATQLTGLRLLALLVPNLRRLALCHHKEIRRLEGLEECPLLEWLDCSFSAVQDIGALGGCEKLQHFAAEYCPLRDLSPLRDCLHLQTLHLSNTLISDLRPLLELKKLRLLTCTDCPKLTQTAREQLREALPHCVLIENL